MTTCALVARPHQVAASTALDNAIWNGGNDRREGPALLVAPVATGKTLILIMVAVAAIERGCSQVVIVSRSRHVAKQSLDTLQAYRPEISGGLYTGSQKQTAQVLFATAPTRSRRER